MIRIEHTRTRSRTIDMSDDTQHTPGSDSAFPTAPWTFSKVEGLNGFPRCEAAVWDSIGDLVAVTTTQLAGTGEIESASDRARLIAAAGTAAAELPDEYDPLRAVQGLAQLIDAAEAGSHTGVHAVLSAMRK